MWTKNFLIFLNLLALVVASKFDLDVQLKGLSLPEIDPNVLEDAHLKVPELIRKYGYPAEVHTVETHDGYILEMHRIPKVNATPVFLMHGLLDASSTWVMMGPHQGLAYMLSDLGYDVWMGNARGNTYSRKHKIHDPNGSAFWQFSFHEIGKIDLPRMIDQVLTVTGKDKLHYIGHSQGTTSFWVFCIENPEYTEKIISMNGLAPVAFGDHGRSPLVNVLTFLLDKFSLLVQLIGPNEFLPNTKFISTVGEIFCKDQIFTQDICAHIIFQITGYNDKQMNKTMLPVVTGHTPAGASTRQLIHFSQINHSGKFRKYNFGYVQNLWKYGSLTPPTYDLSKVDVKVALHYSTNDWLAHPLDVERLHQSLPKPIGKFLVDDHDFNHLDFVWGIDARPFLYERVVQIMKYVEDEQNN